MIKYFVQPNPEGGGRLLVNLSNFEQQKIGWGKQKFLLDTLSVWGGHDRVNPVWNGTVNMSWEFGPTLFPEIEKIAKKWMQQSEVPRSDDSDVIPVWHLADAETFA